MNRSESPSKYPTTYELSSSAISSFLLKPNITAFRCRKFGQPRHARARCASRSVQDDRPTRSDFRAYDCSSAMGRFELRPPKTSACPFLFPLERGHVTPWRRRNRRLPGSNLTLYALCESCIHARDPCASVRATPRKAMECTRPPGQWDGWLCLRDLTSRFENHTYTGAVSIAYPETVRMIPRPD